MSSDDPKLLGQSTPNDWKVATASVTSCRGAFLSGGRIPDTGGPASPTTYVVSFEYVVNKTRYTGKMKRGTPTYPGHRFEISYNPLNPSRNTGSDYQVTWIRVVVWAIGAVIAGVAIYFDNR
jgi:hypothetical protein